MARKIVMTGDEAQYIERRGANSVADDREIRMEGRHARYEEHSGAQATHFPQNHNEAVGKQWFDFLIAKGFIERDSELDSWLYQMGFSNSQPAEVKPIAWRDCTADAYQDSRQPAGVEATDSSQNERTGIAMFHQTGRTTQIIKAQERIFCRC